MRKLLSPLVLLALLPGVVRGQLIAPTDPLTPEQERLKLRVPEGFEVQLVAAEPDIQKPMNLKFDAAGRLWVTHSVEYPFPVKEGQTGRDGITILSDFGPDGRAQKVQKFADGLNIPIGIVPVKDGCIVWSIPHIWKLTDTDGDDVADEREVLFTGFGVEDTHGNQNSFVRWIDGWIYACHGFRNDSHIRRGVDGEILLHLNSGNVYRFKEDGSAIEQISSGQVNPFGLTFDPLGNIYTADCHSRPLTHILRGAHYPSFGKPHDGLGYAPEMIDHDHGSTGISGIAYYAADHFPPDYRDCLYTGNVITNRVHRDALKWHGSTPKADTKEDFIISDDPWFRPVDIQLGADGALYVADFYNRIIGHYEVPLDHPQRDRHRGRIWRVVYKGAYASPPASDGQVAAGDSRAPAVHAVQQYAEKQPWAAQDRAAVLSRLRDANPMVRRFAADALGRHPDLAQIKPLLELWWSTPREDEAMIHTIKIALREHMKRPEIASAVDGLELTDVEKSRLAEVAIAAPNPAAASFVFEHVRSYDTLRGRLAQILPYLARNLPKERVDDLAGFVRERFGSERGFQLTMLGLIQQSVTERGASLTRETKEWVVSLAGELLKPDDAQWTNHLHAEKPTKENPWALQERPLSEGSGGGKAVLISSHPVREQWTGVLRSRPFTIPPKLSFSLCGHNGFPGTNPPPANYIRLVLAETGREIARQDAPRNDTVQRYTWDLSESAGQTGYIEIIDGDTAEAFAWIAAGRFEPAVVSVPAVSPAEATQQKVQALGLIGALRLGELRGEAKRLLGDRAAEPAVRIAASDALLAIKRTALIDELDGLIADPTEPLLLREHIVEKLGRHGRPEAAAPLLAALPIVPESFQQKIALALASHPENVPALLDAIEQGKASPRLLQHETILQRLRAANIDDLDSRIVTLTEGLMPADQRTAQLIADRKAGFQSASTDITRGQAAFARVCAACHAIASTGGRIGPNLDGIGNRGLDRILEDILDPNRNIDAAFRFTTITTKDGQTHAGLPLRTEGETLILADTAGQEHRIPTATITDRKELRLSLMPPGLVETMPQQEFYDLIAYLLAQNPNGN